MLIKRVAVFSTSKNLLYSRREQMKRYLNLLFSALIFVGCQPKSENTLSSFGVFCEMVANDAKPIALNHPMDSEKTDQHWEEYRAIADSYGVSLFREKDFPVTTLFPASVTSQKEVIIIYRGSRLVQYHQFKQDLPFLEPTQAARRFGRLLGYSTYGINQLLMENTSYRSLTSFGVDHQITHLYYEDLETASRFYAETLGLVLEEGVGYKIGEDVSIQLHSYDGYHPKGQPKSTAIAFLTDQLPEWYAHIQKQNVPIKYTYKPHDGGPHDGFVALDPGGYLLEFEQFKQHPENELFMATLEKAPKILTRIDSLTFYGSVTWTYHNDLLKMQRFYEETLGCYMVADQGWTKIYQTSSAGFVGLVDERRGMMDYSDEKAVELEWRLGNTAEATTYFSANKGWWEDKSAIIGPEKYTYLLR